VASGAVASGAVASGYDGAMRFVRVALLLVVGSLVSGALLVLVWTLAHRPGRVAYVGGPVLTMDAANRVVDGIALDGERIAMVGDQRSVLAWAQTHDAEVIELDGRAVLPGFIDAHGHFPGSGIYSVFADLNSPPIGPVRNLDDVVSRMKAEAAKADDGAWLLGIGYDDTLLAEGRHPTRHDLDHASTDHAIAITHVSGHIAVVNSRALEQLGIDRDTPDPVGGLIRRDPESGEPDGVLEEEAMAPIARMLTPTRAQGVKVMQSAIDLYTAAGVTTAQSGLTPQPLVQIFELVSMIGMLPIRLMVWIDSTAADARIADGVGPPDPTEGDAMLRVGAVKLIADGSIQGYTGYLSQPYHIPPGDDPDYRGYPRIPRDELFEQVKRFHDAGFQLAIHGNGDASIDDILDALEAAQTGHPRDDTRHIVIHSQMARDDQLDRMAQLGVIPSFFSLHTFYWGDRHRTLFMGPERAARMSPAKSALSRGIPFTIHADSPVVPMEPLRLVWSAVNRRTRTDYVVGPGQRIGVMDALRAVTINAARQFFEEQDKGSLEPGKLADLVILSRNPLDDPEHIDEIQVQQTIVGGRTVYEKL
jgi:predicted amidohydrolase YtcJ